MKTKLFLTIALLFSSLTFAQYEQDYLLLINETKIGGYLGVGSRYSTVTNSDPAGFFDLKGAVTFNGKWAIGLTGSGLIHTDTKYRELVSNGTYRLYVNYGAFFVERIFSLNDDLKLSLSITSGYGEAFYRYDKDYRKDKVWSEEVIDKTDFYIFEPGLEIQQRINSNWWIGINTTIRNTSPIELIQTDENFLRKLSGGITFKCGVF